MSARSPTLNPKELAECLAVEPPVAIRPVDLECHEDALSLPASRTGKPYRHLLALVRERGKPLGWVVLPVNRGSEVGLDGLAGSFAAARTSPPDLPEFGSDNPATGLLSIVVATCANPGPVLSCVETILASAEGAFEVIVVENRPKGSNVERALAERFGADGRIRYVEEHRRGLASARNAGLEAARGELIAFTDDDVHLDPVWTRAVRGVFAARPEVDCVTGLILPRELETSAQLLDERVASYGKGFVQRTYSMDAPPPDQPLFPYTAGYFGSGANMTFRTDAIRSLGGFDPALGTGTAARASEDLDICIRLLHSGRSLTYEPGAMVWHRHPDTLAGVRRQVFGYGVGLGAMLAKHAVLGPSRWKVLSSSFKGLRYYADPKSRRNALRGPTFPGSLVRLERFGLLLGPFAYLASRLKASRRGTGR